MGTKIITMENKAIQFCVKMFDLMLSGFSYPLSELLKSVEKIVEKNKLQPGVMPHFLNNFVNDILTS